MNQTVNEVASTRKDEGVDNDGVPVSDSLTDLSFYKEATELAIADIKHYKEQSVAAQKEIEELKLQLQDLETQLWERK